MTRQPIPIIPTVHYNMGGVPTNYHGEALRKRDGNPDEVVPGLMALGEGACVSVHGANRLGSNSLIDLVVFGRAAAQRAAELIKPNDTQPELPADSADLALSRLDFFRNANGSVSTATLRDRMQRTMQSHCAVYRTGEVLAEGVELINAVWRDGRRRQDRRSLADLELRSGRDAGIRQSHRAGGHDDGKRRQSHRVARRPCARRFP